MELGLTGKVAIVAASSQGLGRACAEALAREGARVVINGRRPEALAQAAQAIRQVMSVKGADVHTVAGDVTDPEAINRLIKATLARFGQIDILVTNGGGPSPGKFGGPLGARLAGGPRQHTLAGPAAHPCGGPAPHGREGAGRGRIINIVSTSVKQPIPGLFLSNALRPAVIGLAKSLSVELAPDGILVNNVCPGSFDTDRIKHVYEARAEGTPYTVEQVAAQAAEAIPLRRLGDPRELGSVVAFLASDRASYLTGQTLSVDGGLVNSLFG